MKESKNTLIIGDLHFGTKTNSTQWLSAMVDYIYRQIIPTIEDDNIDKVVFLGDVFDVRYSTNTLIGTKVKDIFRDLASSHENVEFYIIAGNHDYYSPKPEDMHYNVYEMVFGKEFTSIYKNFHIYTEVPYLDDDGDLYLPWFYSENDELYYQTLEHFKSDYIRRIYCHSDLQCWTQSKIIAKKSAYVYSGHIHTPWKDIENRLWNVGSALPLNFNDVNEDKNVYILYSDETYKSITNTTTPKFLRYYNEEIFKHDKFNNCFVQFYIDKDKVNKAEYIERYKNLKVMNPDIQMRVVTIDTDMVKNIESGINLNQDIKEYIDSNIPDGLQPKYKLIKNKLNEKEK